ncbi:ABC transporter substrate-binding protein [Bradyrhizobium sp. USDA 4452]
MRQARVESQIDLLADSNGVQDKAYYDALGKYGDGAVLSTLWYNPKAPDAAAIFKRFAADYPNDWLDANSGAGFEAVQIVADAVSRAGSSESGAIHAALKATDMTPILMSTGRIKFDASGQNMGGDVTMLQGQNGRPRVVAPQAAAEATLQYPLAPFNSR